MCHVHYDVIYHPSSINSQYLKTWEVESPVKGTLAVPVQSLKGLSFCQELVAILNLGKSHE